MDRRGLTVYAEYPIIDVSHVVTITVRVGMGGPTSMLSHATLLHYFQVLLTQKKMASNVISAFGLPEGGPYTGFTFTGSVRNI